MLLPDGYIKQLTDAAHGVGAIFVLDCVAAGALWTDMQVLGIDVLITAPQKGWTSTPCAGVIMLSDRALERMAVTESDSFALNLKKWHSVMAAYLNGGHTYHATMPTDGLAKLYETYQEMANIGFDFLKARQIELGNETRSLIDDFGFKSLAAEGFKSPTVVVSHTDRADFKNGSAFAGVGMQIAAGVPLECGESPNFQTFPYWIIWSRQTVEYRSHHLPPKQGPKRNLLNFMYYCCNTVELNTSPPEDPTNFLPTMSRGHQ